MRGHEDDLLRPRGAPLLGHGVPVRPHRDPPREGARREAVGRQLLHRPVHGTLARRPRVRVAGQEGVGASPDRHGDLPGQPRDEARRRLGRHAGDEARHDRVVRRGSAEQRPARRPPPGRRGRQAPDDETGLVEARDVGRRHPRHGVAPHGREETPGRQLERGRPPGAGRDEGVGDAPRVDVEDDVPRGSRRRARPRSRRPLRPGRGPRGRGRRPRRRGAPGPAASRRGAPGSPRGGGGGGGRPVPSSSAFHPQG